MAAKDLSNLLVGKDRKSRTEGNGTEKPEEVLSKSASLLDDTLSDKKKKTNWKTPIWISALVIAAGLLVLFFSGQGTPDDPLMPGQADASRNPELLEKLVNEAKVSETGGSKSGLQAEPLRQNNSTPANNSPAVQAQAKTTQAVQPPARKAPAVQKPSKTSAAASTQPNTPPKTAAQSPAPDAEKESIPENMPQLIRDVKNELPPEETTPAAVPVDPHQESFNYLEQNNPVAGKLVKGGYSNLSYSNWKVIRETSQEVWIDLEASWSTGGPAIHHIWSVDIANKKIKALSQAARNLEALDK